MTMIKRVQFRWIAQVLVLGLALAFVVTLLWPELLRREGPAVEIRQTAPETPRAAGPYSYSSAVEKAAPAVVNINTAKVVTVRPHPFFDDPVFRQFFGRGLDSQLTTPQRQVERSLGSQLPLILDGGTSPAAKPSTVLKLQENSWEIIRVGAISPQEIAEFLQSAT